MTKRFWAAALVFAVAATVVAGCGGTTAKDTPAPPTASKEAPKTEAKVTTYPITLKDATGREVTLTAEPKRIISIAPSNTELVFALGKGSLLVGRTDFCDFPAEAKQIESVGSLFPPNYEKIVSLKADLILMMGGNEPERTKLINDYKQTVFVVQPNNFEQLYAGIKNLGVILNAQPAAEKVVTDMQSQVKAVTDKVAKATTKPSVFYPTWTDPLMTAGSETFLDDIIRLAGGTNAAADVKGFTTYSMEKLQATNPDFLVTGSKDVTDKIKADKAWAGFKAVKENKLVQVPDNNLVTRPGPRIVQGLQWFAETLHPEVMK